jgi:predicted  nucleic acid-binding Zn-ribbon protein
MSHEHNQPQNQASPESTHALSSSGFDDGDTGQFMAAPPFQLQASAADAPPTQLKASSGGLDGELVNGFAATSGHDLSDVNVHRNSSKPSEVGALAYAQGNDIHLGPGQDKHLPHEAAHIVQQREGRVKPTTEVNGMAVNDNQGLESEADRMGDQAAQMKTADVAGQRKVASNPAMQRKEVGGNVKQLYKQYTNAGETDAKTGVHWKANNDPLRVAEDGTAAMAQARASGGQEMYVDSGRLPGINSDLKKVNAPVAFAELGGKSVEGATPGNLSGAKKKLSQVKPVEPADHSKVKKIPDDCGNAARTVTGSFAEGKTLKAKYNDGAGNAKNTSNSDPELMKYEIMVDHHDKQIPDSSKILAKISSKIDSKNDLYKQMEPYWKRITPVSDQLTKVREEFKKKFQYAKDKIAAYNAERTKIATNDPKKKERIEAIDQSIKDLIDKFETYQKTAQAEEKNLMKKWQDILDEKIGVKTVSEVMDQYFATVKEYESLKAAIMKPYNDLSPADREIFDQKTGINRHANPEVGEAYTISSGGNDYVGKSTWNFHWGGVVFKSTTGSDNITLENYAGNANSEWRLQMYGVPSVGNDRKDQTFHEAHEATKQHGDNPTTLTTEKK